MKRSLVLSCEHASCKIPAEFKSSFRGQASLLRSHRGWDPGALEVASRLARRLSAPLLAARYSRLLVDLNRSPGHPRVFSTWSRGLPFETRARLLETLHDPHWRAVADAVTRQLPGVERRAAKAALRLPVVQLALHSFTPVLDGVTRNAELGLLYDPARPAELSLALDLQRLLREPGLRVRRNYPYRGVADGLPTELRRRFKAREYAGLEIELNQAWLSQIGAPDVARRLGDALAALGF